MSINLYLMHEEICHVKSLCQQILINMTYIAVDMARIQ